MRTGYMALILAGALITTALSGCTETVQMKSDSQWCINLKTELENNGFGWPVGNKNLNSSELDKIESIFDSEHHLAQGDLGIAAQGWLQGFRHAKPYLEINDPEAFTREVSEEMQNQLQLANLAISNICQWDNW